MPRRALSFEAGHYYHIYNRGAGRQSIMREESNYACLLRLLAQVAHECRVSVIAYCLLPNHYHWLLRQDGDTPAGAVPKRVFGSYTQTFNLLYQRTGTLFQGRFQAVPVESDEYLRHLCRYIHANPVRHAIAADVELWPYSNYPEWIGRRDGRLVDRAFVQQHFPAPGQYQAYVASLLTGRAAPPKGLQTYLDELES